MKNAQEIDPELKGLDAVDMFVKDVERLDAQPLTREEEIRYFSQVENGRAGYLLLRLFAPNDPWVEKEFKGYLSKESAQEFLLTTGFTPYFEAQKSIVKTNQKRNKPKEEDPDKELEFEGDTVFVLTNIGCSFTDDNLALLRRYIDEGKEAKEQIANHNLKWVIKRVARFKGQGLGIDELIQEGNIGMLRAVEKFDRRRGFKFLTYATHWIEQGVQRAIADSSRIIDLPVHMHELTGRFLKIQSILTNKLERYPTDQEIAEEWGISIEKVIKIREALERVRTPDSLDYPVGEGEDSTVGDFVPDTSISDFGDIAVSNERAKRIRAILTEDYRISRKKAGIIYLRFGLDRKDQEGRTLQETADIVGLTRERIRQIVDEVLRKMRGLNEIKELAEE